MLKTSRLILVKVMRFVKVKKKEIPYKLNDFVTLLTTVFYITEVIIEDGQTIIEPREIKVVTEMYDYE